MANFSLKFDTRGMLGDVDTLLRIVTPHIEKAGLVVQAGVMASSPVKTGDLRRRWNVRSVVVDGTKAVASVGNDTPYARYQNTRTRNRGYVKQGIDASKAQAIQVLAEGIHADIQKMWEK